MVADVQRDLGRHDARLDAMEADLQEMKAQMAKMVEQMSAINTTLSTAKGGWKTLLLVGGAIGVAVHAVVWITDKLALFFHR